MKKLSYMNRFTKTNWLRVLGAIVIAATFVSTARAAQSVTLAWDPSPDSSVVGYIVYYGLAGGSSTNSLDAANQTTATVPNLTAGSTEFFYVKAYNSQRVESLPSNLINYTIPVVANTPPTISSIANRTISEDTTTGAIGFTVGDTETVAGSLSVSGGSSNPTLVPSANIVFGGTGANRTVTVTPAVNQAGTATITVTVSDGTTSTSTSFALTVSVVNDLPTISSIANRTVNEDTTTEAISFTVGDVETTAGSLTVSGSSSNPTLVPNANIVFGGSGASRTVTVTPAATQSGTATITVTVNDGSASTSTSFALTVSATANTPPTITSTANRTINEDTTTGAIGFTVGDVETAAGSLTLSGSSSNPTLVPNANVVFGGSGSSRTVTVTPAANQSGTATIAITVSDGQASTTTSFALSVSPVNDAPTLSSIASQTLAAGGATGAISFTVGDAETAAGNLVVSGSSSSQTLVPNANIAFGGSGTSRTVTVTPAAGQTGTATITVSVSDGSAGTSASFVLTVNAAGPYVYLPIEAEGATLVSPMAAALDGNAGHQAFIQTSATDSGTVTYTVNIPVAGSYLIWCRVLSPDDVRDSFYVSADGGAEDIFDTVPGTFTNTWQWSAVQGRSVSNIVTIAGVPVRLRVFQFSAGAHTITFRGREAGTGLDQLLLTNDPNYVPDVLLSIAGPPLLISSISYDPAGFVTVSWATVPGKSYRVSYKSSLKDSAWKPLGQAVTAASAITTHSDYVTGNRFYKVQQLP
jgi:hypothetical protein